MPPERLFKHVVFAELPVEDQDRAADFYAQRLGLRVARDMPYQEDWRWLELEVPGSPTRLLMSRRSGPAPTASDGRPVAPSLTLATDDVDGAYEALVAEGVEFVQEPATPPWNPKGRYALLRDSEGNVVLIQS